MALFKSKKKADDVTAHPGTLLEYLAPSAVSVSPTHIEIGDRFARTLFVASYPRYVDTGWFSPIINLDRQMDISIFLHPQDSGDILNKLRKQLGRVEAETIEEQAAGKVRNPKLETAMRDIESLRDKLQQGTERFFELGIYITFYGDSVKELDEGESAIRGILDTHLVYTKKATFRMPEGIRSTAPTATDELKIHTPANTGPISSIFPFVSFDLTADEGILYGINLHNNSLVLFDRFEMENANQVVFGKSGGGKSYLVKLEILRSMLFGTQIIVVDPENEYQYLAESVGGTIANISLGSNDHINPFDIPQVGPDETFGEVLRSHVANLSGFFRLALGGLTPEEESLLDEAIQQTFASKDITATSDPATIKAPLFSDFEDILKHMTGTESLALRVQRFSQGSFAGFLNHPTNVRLDRQLLVFSIRDLEDELRPVAMYLIINHVWMQIRSKLKKRVLIIDEAWWLLKRELGGQFLLNMAKRARKYYLGLTTISQDVEDFLQSEYGKPILTNSSIQILMKQHPAAIDLIQKTFNITDSEKYYLLEAAVGRGLFFAGRDHIALRVVASYPEDQIITSDPRQLLEIREAKEELERAAAGN